MDPEEVKKKRMARRTLAVSEFCSHLERDYKMTVYCDNEVTDTGLLVVAELSPEKGKSGPRFHFRWDEKAQQLDIDALDVPSALKRQFEEGKAGYEGHHPVRSSSTSRTFHSKVVWDKRTLYEGDVTIPLAHEASVTAGLGLAVTISEEHLRRCQACGKQFTPVGNEMTCPECRV